MPNVRPNVEGRVAQIRTEEKAAALSEERSKIPTTSEDSSIAAAEDGRAPGFGQHALIQALRRLYSAALAS